MFSTHIFQLWIKNFLIYNWKMCQKMLHLPLWIFSFLSISFWDHGSWGGNAAPWENLPCRKAHTILTRASRFRAGQKIPFSQQIPSFHIVNAKKRERERDREEKGGLNNLYKVWNKYYFSMHDSLYEEQSPLPWFAPVRSGKVTYRWNRRMPGASLQSGLILNKK